MWDLEVEGAGGLGGMDWVLISNTLINSTLNDLNDLRIFQQ